MELVIERIKQTKNYTLSRLYEPGQKFFTFDVVEPPIRGLAKDGEIAALNPGRYKLYLKPDKRECEIVACFQSVERKNRFGFQKVDEITKISELKFRSDGWIFNIPLRLGKLADLNREITPYPEGYNRLMMRLIIAKQQQDVIRILIK